MPKIRIKKGLHTFLKKSCNNYDNSRVKNKGKKFILDRYSQKVRTIFIMLCRKLKILNGNVLDSLIVLVLVKRKTASTM